MKKLINFILGFIAVISPIVLAVIFSILIYNELTNCIGQLIGVVLILGGVWTAFQIYQSIKHKGFLSFITAVHASPDLDNINPAHDSNTKKRTAAQLATLFTTKNSLFKGGTLNIFGDRFGELKHNYLDILAVNFDASENTMTIQMSQNTKVTISEPSSILESPSVLKITSAKEIRIDFQQAGSESQKNAYKIYSKQNNKIDIDSNIDCTSSRQKVSIGEDALIIFA